MDILTFLLIFVVIPTVLIMKFKPKFIDFEFIFVLLRFKKGKSIFDILANKCPRFWNFVGEFGIVFGFGLLGSLYLLKQNVSFKKCLFYQILHTLISAVLIVFITRAFVIHMYVICSLFGISFLMVDMLFEKAVSIVLDYIHGSSYVSPGVAPVIPGVKIKNVPSYFSVPLYAVISLVIIIIFHEGFHGILCRLEKIDLKSYGLVFLGLLPIGAFVEPDENSLNSKRSIQKNKMYAAGSMGNIVLFIIFFSLWIFVGYLLSIDHVEFKVFYNITHVDKNFSSKIVPGTRLYHIYYDQNHKILSLNTSRGTITLNNISLSEFFAYVDYNTVVKPKDKYWLYVLLDIIKYTWLLSLMVGLINYLPLLIFDGARMFEEISKTLFNSTRAVKYLNIFILILLIINALPLFI